MRSARTTRAKRTSILRAATRVRARVRQRQLWSSRIVTSSRFINSTLWALAKFKSKRVASPHSSINLLPLGPLFTLQRQEQVKVKSRMQLSKLSYILMHAHLQLEVNWYRTKQEPRQSQRLPRNKNLPLYISRPIKIQLVLNKTFLSAAVSNQVVKVGHQGMYLRRVSSDLSLFLSSELPRGTP